ncbi:hypothetical protein AB3N59_13260 [Leptospira sp. WS92.C1]
MQTKQNRIKIIVAIILIGLTFNFYNCGDEKKDNNLSNLVIAILAIQGGVADLPQPVDGTAFIKIGNDEMLTLTDEFSCQSGVNGVIFGMADADNLPILNIHNIDFAQTTGQSLGVGGSQLDIDVRNDASGPYQAGTNNVEGNCPATVKETSATIFDIQVLNCPITRQNPAATLPDTTVSFRARCTR